VWTTFNTWQWDLAWDNPDVLCEFVEIICFLANQGVECLRLDAIAFLWKRMGTDCQNQPEVHAVTQALRAAARIAAPALVFKAEAIVGPAQLVPYLGVGTHTGKVSDLAYHNSLMVQLWSSLAARDARLATAALRRFPRKPTTTAWATYVRGHDDIGWAIDDADAREVGWDGWSHRAFLSDFYGGGFEGSFARGLVFQENPATGDRRISGSTASLAGLETATTAEERDLAVRRLLLAHTAVLGFGGVPVVWMGDELALRNDQEWASDPGHADDNRWVHRPRMPWDVAERRTEPGTVEHAVWTGLRERARVRASLPALHASVEADLLDAVTPAVLAWVRRAPEQELVALHNTSDHRQVWPGWAVPLGGPVHDVLSGDVFPTAATWCSSRTRCAGWCADRCAGSERGWEPRRPGQAGHERHSAARNAGRWQALHQVRAATGPATRRQERSMTTTTPPAIHDTPTPRPRSPPPTAATAAAPRPTSGRRCPAAPSCCSAATTATPTGRRCSWPVRPCTTRPTSCSSAGSPAPPDLGRPESPSSSRRAGSRRAGTVSRSSSRRSSHRRLARRAPGCRSRRRPG
jgi:glycosidase